MLISINLQRRQTRPPRRRLRRSAAGDLDNGRNEECQQGQYEHDLGGGESRSRKDAGAKRACDQSDDDKKSDRPAKHQVPLRAARGCWPRNAFGAAYVPMTHASYRDSKDNFQEIDLLHRPRIFAGTMTTLTAFLRHRNSNRGEVACLRNLTPRRRNITKTPRRAIGLL